MDRRLFFVVFVTVAIAASANIAKDEAITTETSQEENDSGLFRLDGVSVGHTQWVSATFRTQSGARKKQPLMMRTLSLQPLIFEIPDFLTSKECKQVINLAKEMGMSSSMTVDDAAEKEMRESSAFHKMTADDKDDMFKEVDQDMDGLLSIAEMEKFLRKSDDTAMTHDDIQKMLKELKLDKNKDGWLNQREFFDINEKAIQKYISKYREDNPISRTRYSQQTWLRNGERVFSDIQKRVQEVTQLRMDVILSSEEMQVVRYGSVGHYNCHHDSDPLNGPEPTDDPEDDEEEESETSDGPHPEGPPCCHYNSQYGEHCRLCRLLTIMYYLNDVEEGGATAFPAIGNSQYLTNKTARKEFQSSKYCNLTSYCGQAGLVVQPERGKALLWYNHFLDSKGEIGSMDFSTLHGGCGVRRGTKWIANTWINFEPFMVEEPPQEEEQQRPPYGWMPKPSSQDTCGTDNHNNPSQSMGSCAQLGP